MSCAMFATGADLSPLLPQPGAAAPAGGLPAALFDAAHADLTGTPAAAYLARLTARDGFAGFAALRYHPALHNRESGRRWPALLAALRDRRGTLVAVQATWLQRQPDGAWWPAPLLRPRRCIGPLQGAAARLWRPELVPAAVHHRTARQAVVLTGGVGLAVRTAIDHPSMRVLAAVDLTNMVKLTLPGSAETVVIRVCHRDLVKRRAVIEHAAATLRSRGRVVEIIDEQASPPASAGHMETSRCPATRAT